MTGISQVELRGGGIRAPVSRQTTSTQITPVVQADTVEELIKQQRNIIIDSKKALGETILSSKITSKRLRTLSPQQRQQLKKRSVEATKLKGKLDIDILSFEREVAEKSPKFADPIVKAERLKTARDYAQSQVDRFQKQEAKYSKYERQARKDDNESREMRYEYKQEEAGAKKDVWRNLLKKDDNTLLKEYYSGYTKKKANYEADLERAEYDRDRGMARDKQEALDRGAIISGGLIWDKDKSGQYQATGYSDIKQGSDMLKALNKENLRVGKLQSIETPFYSESFGGRFDSGKFYPTSNKSFKPVADVKIQTKSTSQLQAELLGMLGATQTQAQKDLFSENYNTSKPLGSMIFTDAEIKRQEDVKKFTDTRTLSPFFKFLPYSVRAKTYDKSKEGIKEHEKVMSYIGDKIDVAKPIISKGFVEVAKRVPIFGLGLPTAPTFKGTKLGDIYSDKQIASLAEPMSKGVGKIAQAPALGFEYLSGLTTKKARAKLEKDLQEEVNKIAISFQEGKITESRYTEKIDAARKRAEKKSTLLTVRETALEEGTETLLGIASLGLLTPIIEGSELALLSSRYSDIKKMIAEKPGQTSIVAGAGVAAGMSVGGATKFWKLNNFKNLEPNIRYTSNVDVKIKDYSDLNKLGYDKTTARKMGISLDDLKRKDITANRKYVIDVPNPKGKNIKIEIIEIQKNGRSKFAGIERIDGKITRIQSGNIMSTGKQAVVSMLDMSIKKNWRGIYKDASYKQYMVRVKDKMNILSPQQKLGILERADGFTVETRALHETKLKGAKDIDIEFFKGLVADPLKIKKGEKLYTPKEFAGSKRISDAYIESIKKIKKAEETRIKTSQFGFDGGAKKAITREIKKETISFSDQLKKQNLIDIKRRKHAKLGEASFFKMEEKIIGLSEAGRPGVKIKVTETKQAKVSPVDTLFLTETKDAILGKKRIKYGERGGIDVVPFVEPKKAKKTFREKVLEHSIMVDNKFKNTLQKVHHNINKKFEIKIFDLNVKKVELQKTGNVKKINVIDKKISNLNKKISNEFTKYQNRLGLTEKRIGKAGSDISRITSRKPKPIDKLLKIELKKKHLDTIKKQDKIMQQAQNKLLMETKKDQIFYHGTSQRNIDSILRNGLFPGDLKGGSREGGLVFLTSNKKLAAKYATDKGSVLRVLLSKADIAKADKFGIGKLRGEKGNIIGIPKKIPIESIDIKGLNKKIASDIKKSMKKIEAKGGLAAGAFHELGRESVARTVKEYKIGEFKAGMKTGLKTSASSLLKGKTFKQAEAELFKQKDMTKVKQAIGMKQSVAQKMKSLSKLKPFQSMKMDLQKIKIHSPTIRIPPPIVTPRIRIPRITDIKKPKLKIKIKKPTLAKQSEFYIPYAKRNDKWVKLSATGMTKASALSRGARAVDKTISARFKIKSTEKGKKTVDPYYAQSMKKFRDFEIIKGTKNPLVNEFIEKKGRSRIDTPGEKKGLTLSKLIKQKNWLGKKKNKKRLAI